MKTLSSKLAIVAVLSGILFIYPYSGNTQDLISFKPFNRVEFSPTRNQHFDISFNLTGAAKAGVKLYTSDGHLVRNLSSGKVLKPGVHVISWDGRDFEKKVVPDEAYTAVLYAITKTQAITVDPRKNSGGEIEKVVSTVILREGKVIYTLSKPSRVQIRAGIVNGPMLRSLAAWRPRPSGKNLQRWNGFDEDKIINLFSIENHGVSVTAFNLPDYTIITTGNNALSYREYYEKKHWTFIPVPEDKRLLERNHKAISLHYYSSPVTDRNPKINIILPDNIKRSEADIPILKIDKPVPVKVLMAEKDEQIMAETKYEVSFFVDLEFKSEEELGYIPITWLYSPNNLKIIDKHTLTVNISGFKGHVGVKTIQFMVE